MWIIFHTHTSNIIPFVHEMLAGNMFIIVVDKLILEHNYIQKQHG